jgi:hypothetical protein
MRKRMFLVTAVAAACALAAVATALAASGKAHKKASTTRHTTASTETGGWAGPHGPGGPGMRGAVHSVSVVLNRKGDAFITQTTDSGTVQSVDTGAGTITIVEGVKGVTYKTVTLTIPSEATVVLDGKSSSLGSIVADDHAVVSSSSEGTTVFAADSSFRPSGMPHGGPPEGAGPPAGF